MDGYEEIAVAAGILNVALPIAILAYERGEMTSTSAPGPLRHWSGALKRAGRHAFQ